MNVTWPLPNQTIMLAKRLMTGAAMPSLRRGGDPAYVMVGTPIELTCPPFVGLTIRAEGPPAWFETLVSIEYVIDGPFGGRLLAWSMTDATLTTDWQQHTQRLGYGKDLRSFEALREEHGELVAEHLTRYLERPGWVILDRDNVPDDWIPTPKWLDAIITEPSIAPSLSTTQAGPR